MRIIKSNGKNQKRVYNIFDNYFVFCFFIMLTTKIYQKIEAQGQKRKRTVFFDESMDRFEAG